MATTGTYKLHSNSHESDLQDTEAQRPEPSMRKGWCDGELGIHLGVFEN